MIKLGLVMFFSIAIASCGGGGGGSSAPAPTTGSLKFVNNSSHGIDRAYATLSSSSTWGSIRNSSPIAAGSSWTLSDVTPGTYDARVASDGTVSTYYAYGWGFPITVGTTYTLTATDSSYTGSLIVYNTNPTYPITALYVSATALGGGTTVLSTSIAPGASRQIVAIPSGTYYVRAVQNGFNRDNSGVSIASYSYTTITYN